MGQCKIVSPLRGSKGSLYLLPGFFFFFFRKPTVLTGKDGENPEKAFSGGTGLGEEEQL